MAVDITWLNNAYAITGEGLPYIEGQCEERSDITGFSTEYLIGSKVVCTEDWSLWVLSRNGVGKEWKEVTV